MVDEELKKQINRALFLRTRGIMSEIDLDEQMAMLAIAKQHFYNGVTDFAVFDPEAEEKRYEDENRTVIIPYKTIPRKVYVKLDDYGSIENVERASGLTGLRSRFVITMLFPEEY